MKYGFEQLVCCRPSSISTTKPTMEKSRCPWATKKYIWMRRTSTNSSSTSLQAMTDG